MAQSANSLRTAILKEKNAVSREEQKIFQFRMEKELFEAFYKAFPGKGERKLLLLRVVELLVERKGEKDCFVEGVLQEAREIYTDLEEEGE